MENKLETTIMGPPTLGGVLDGFSNGEGENPLPVSLQNDEKLAQA